MEENLTMADLMAEVDKSMTRIYRGQVLPATVALVNEQGVIVNIGYQADGIIPWNEVSVDEVDHSSIKEGDTFEVTVLKIDDGEGNVLVSKKRAEEQNVLNEVEALFNEKKTFTVRVKEVVKGGVVAPFKGLRAFIPGSQLTNTYVNDLNAFVGKEIAVEIIEFVPKNRKLVLSGKRLAAEKAQSEKEAKIAALEEGQKLQGTVTKLMPYGAFVNLGGVEGLVHNNDLSWVRIKHPSDVVKEGDKVDVVILSVDKETGKIALSLKDMTTDPWFVDAASFELGQVVTAEVTRFASFGAFAKLTDNVEGLIHISQISEKRIHKAEEALEIGQKVQVKIIVLDKETKKVGLSIKQVEEEVDDSMKAYMSTGDEGATLGDVIGNNL
ncbi:MAG: 30S ribosomal protein S1 [Cellulosilyticum sp.]|nr:30S ribosomal protein S1 [Cellulosilyticum sp.]